MIKVDGKSVYISGPVTGRDYDEAYAEFLDARKELRGRGANHCFVPMEVVPRDTSHCAAMQWCIHCLTAQGFDNTKDYVTPNYDMLVSLPGWEQSAGARLEREVAEVCGIECHDLAEVLGE